MAVNWNVKDWGNRVHVDSSGSWMGEKQPVSPAQVPTWGPWAEHAPRCGCSTCR